MPPHTLIILGGEQLDGGLRSAFETTHPARPSRVILIGWGFNPGKPRTASYRLGLAKEALGLNDDQARMVMPNESVPGGFPPDSGCVFCGGNPVVLVGWLASHSVCLPDQPILLQAGSAAAAGSHIIDLRSSPPGLAAGLGWLPGYAVIPHADHLLAPQMDTCHRLLAEAGINGLLLNEDAAAQIMGGQVTSLASGLIRIMTPDSGTMWVESAHPMDL